MKTLVFEFIVRLKITLCYFRQRDPGIFMGFFISHLVGAIFFVLCYYLFVLRNFKF